MNNFSRRTLFSLVIVSLLLTAISIAAASQLQLGSPPEYPESPDQTSASSADLETAGYLPFLVGIELKPSPWLDTQNRAASMQFYLNDYGPENEPMGWTGDHANCQPGTTSTAYMQAILTRINFFRTMAGIPAITGFQEEYNEKAQAAALMMSVNNRLSHSPDAGWKCYSDSGREGAGSSNLFLGRSGPSAITGYVYDPGANNYPVGHRRWILYPQTQTMGVGNIPAGGGNSTANALWVFDRENMWGERPETRDGFVAWPPRGYLPYLLAFPRWSFSYPGADFKDATMIMMKDGSSMDLTIQDVRNGYGENTLVWEPDPNTQERPSQDVVYKVSIMDVMVKGQAVKFEYEVILFDPTG